MFFFSPLEGKGPLLPPPLYLLFSFSLSLLSFIWMSRCRGRGTAEHTGTMETGKGLMCTEPINKHAQPLCSLSPTHIHSDTLHTHTLWCRHTLSCKPIWDPSTHLKIKAQINKRSQKQNKTQTTIKKDKILKTVTIIISAWGHMKARDTGCVTVQCLSMWKICSFRCSTKNKSKK